MAPGFRERPRPGRFWNLDLRDASSFEAQDRRIMALPSPLQRGFDGWESREHIGGSHVWLGPP